MLRIFILLVLYCNSLLLPAISLAQTINWANRLGGTHWDESADLLLSPAGDALFVAGMVSDTISWQNGSSLATHGSGDFWIARYDNNGTPIWMQSGGGRTDDRFNTVALSPTADAVYAAGQVRDTLVLGADSIKTDGLFSDDPLVVKYNAQNGNLLWQRHWKGIGIATARSIAADAIGNVYVGIVFEDSIFVQTDSLAALGSSDILLLKLNADGVLQWYRQFGGIGADVVSDMTIAPDGSLYLGGYFQKTAIWGSTTLLAADENDLLMARIDPNGNVLWAKREGGEYAESISAIALTQQGNVYWAGSFNLQTQIGDSTLSTNEGIAATLLLQTDSLGNIAWVRQSNGIISGATGICTDSAGNAYLSGYFIENVQFGNHSLTATGSTELFVVRYSPNGEAQWLRGIAAAQNSDFNQAAAVQVDATGKCYVTGAYLGLLNADGDALPSLGFADIFLLQLSQPLIISIKPIPTTTTTLSASYDGQGQLIARYSYQPSTPYTSNAQIAIYNTYGQLIAVQNVPPPLSAAYPNLQSTTIALPTALQPGIYIVSLQHAGQIAKSISTFIGKY